MTMTDKLQALVEKVARAIYASGADVSAGEAIKAAEAAIRCVAEATREASEAMLVGGNDAEPDQQDMRTKPPFYPRTRARWRAMHAASVLGEALRDGE
jgi:hypothetical protein